MHEEESKSLKKSKTSLELLRYAYLGNNYEFLMIASSSLSSTGEEKLLKVIKEHKLALGYISNIKCISSSIIMHKILMEKEFESSIEYQRRLNPTIKEG